MSYGLTSLDLFAQVGAIYLNFGLWAVAILPAWLVLRHFGQNSKVSSEDDEAVQTTETIPKSESHTDSH